MKIEKFEDLLGQTIISIENKTEEELVFTLSNGLRCKLHHIQDCCEYVYIEDINGNLEDLLNMPLTLAEVRQNEDFGDCKDGSCTWTFYSFATVKGYVTIGWVGESNGYYSEEVNFTII